MSTTLRALGAPRTLSRRAWILASLALVIAVALVVVPDLSAQSTKMSDGTGFGEGGYFNSLVYDATVSYTMCWVARMLRWVGLGTSLVLAMWKGYKAVDGMGSGWKSVVIYLLVAGFLASPRSAFGAGGLIRISPVEAFISQCGLG